MNRFLVDDADERDHFAEEPCLLYDRDPPQLLKYIALEKRPRRTPLQRTVRAIWRGWLCVKPLVCVILGMVAMWAFAIWFLTLTPP